MGMDRERTAPLHRFQVLETVARDDADGSAGRGRRPRRSGLQVAGVGGGPGGFAVDAPAEQRLLSREDLLVAHRLSATARLQDRVQGQLGVDDVGDLKTRDDRGALHLHR